MTTKKQILTVINTIFLFLYLLVSVYCCAGSYCSYSLYYDTESEKLSEDSNPPPVTYDGLVFLNYKEVDAYKKLKMVCKYFPFLLEIPFGGLLFVLASGAGVFGGTIRVFIELLINEKNITNIPVIYLPIFAGCLGIMVLCVSYALPTALTWQSTTPQPIMIFSLSSLGGIFTEKTVNWLEGQFKKRLSSKKGE